MPFRHLPRLLYILPAFLIIISSFSIIIASYHSLASIPHTSSLQWKLYNSGGYQFEYPSDWDYIDTSQVTLGYLSTFTKHNSIEEVMHIYEGLRYSQALNKTLTYEEVVKEERNIIYQIGSGIKEENILLDRLPAIKFTYKNGRGYFANEVISNSGNNIFMTISAEVMYSNKDNFASQFNHLLSTFKFLSQTSPTPSPVSYCTSDKDCLCRPPPASPGHVSPMYVLLGTCNLTTHRCQPCF